MSETTSGKIHFAGKESLMKELQRTVAFLAYNTVLKSGVSKTAKALQDNVHALYFGDQSPDTIGLAEQLLRGMGAFAPLFDQEIDQANGNVVLKMKKIYHLTDETIIVSNNPRDKGINMAVLASKRLSNRVKLTPRAIWDFGKLVEKNGKKALAMLAQSEYGPHLKTGTMPSGKNYIDYLSFLRESMFKELGGSTTDADEEDENSQNENADGDQMKDSWMFSGFIAFALWGPVLPANMEIEWQAEAFMESDNTKRRHNNRKSSGEKKLLVGQSSQSLSSKTMVDDKSDALMYASAVQTFSTNIMIAKNKKIDREMNIIKERIKRAESERDVWKSFLTAEMIMDGENEIYQKFNSAIEKLHEAEAELDSFVSKINQTDMGSVPYEHVVKQALTICNPDIDMDSETPYTRKKPRRSGTPMSSIDILMEKEDDDFSNE